VRILLLSDIHANLEALQACLAAAPEHDAVANLGDVVGYGASPNEVTAIARELKSSIVRGNHDKACTGQVGLDDFNAVAAQAARWTQGELDDDNLEWLRTLPQGPVEMEYEGANGTRPVLAHGSPLDEDEYILSLQEALEVVSSSSTPLTFFGHTHVQGGFSLDAALNGRGFRPQYDTPDQPEQFRITLESGTRYLINPGSIGQPRDGDWRAAFAIFSTNEKAVTFFRIPYDIAGAQRRIRAAKLPERLASRLAEGR
jgi:predicted phosphodiesterase